MRRIHVLGDLNLDLILSGMADPPAPGREILARERTFKAGGSAANVAVVLALLGAPVRLFACVGRDREGALALADLHRQGLGTSTIRRLPGVPTGVTVSLSYPQERMYVTDPGVLAEAGLESFRKGYLRRGAHLHLASLFLQRRLRASVPGLLARAKRAGMTTSLDPGHDPEGLWELGELGAGLAYLDWLLPNASEACGLAGVGELQGALGRLGNRMRDARREARRDARRDARRNTRGAPRTHGTPGDARAAGGAPFGIVAKEGSAGAWLWQDGGISHSPATRVAAPLDPACAGDCFDAGFLHALCGGSTPEQAVAAGNRLGALAVSFLGLPPREQLRKGGLAGAAGGDS